MRQLAALVAAALLGCASTGPAGAQESDAPGKSGSPAGTPLPGGGETPVVVTQEVLDGWNYLYRFITEAEFVLCLEGREQDGRLIIDGFRLAQMEDATSTSVRYQPCRSERYVGTAHNHPPVGDGGPPCYRSMPDRRSFELDTRAIVDVVLCGENRYLWILRDGTTGGRGLGAVAR